MAILNDSDFVEVEGRYYKNPQVALDESNKGLSITYALPNKLITNRFKQTLTISGTAAEQPQGGLTSPVTDGNGGAGMSYFTSRYQVPPDLNSRPWLISEQPPKHKP